MTTITTALIKELREATGAGLLDCKKALEASGGDLTLAKDALRAKGLAQAMKKAERATLAGLVVVKSSADAAVAVEVKCETDFVASTPDFKRFTHRLAEQMLADPALTSGEAALAADFIDAPGIPVSEVLQSLIGKLGENMGVSAVRYAAGAGGVLEAYVHAGGLAGEFGPQEGRVAVLVEVAADDPARAGREALQALAHDLALHITVNSPRYVGPDDIPAAELDEQRARLTAELAAEKKPEAIKAKIVQGRLDKYLQAVCLLPQVFLRDDSLTIAQLLEKHGQALGTPLRVERFVRLEPAAGAEAAAD